MPTLSEDRDAIRHVMARYCLYMDASRGDEFASLFTEDGSFDTQMGDPVVGRAALSSLATMAPAGAMHHMFTNLVIDVDGDEAVCNASAVVLSKGAIVMSAHTHDELQRVDGEWLIKLRTFEADPQ
jgi:uncharacterized protein (TIGR02246 family)